VPVVDYRRRGGGSAVNIDSSALLSALHRLADAGATVQAETTPALAEILVTSVQEVFTREGAVAGRPKWQDLAESTKENRLRKLRGGKSLRGGGGTYLEGGQWYTESAKDRRARIKRQGKAREKRKQRESSIAFTILQDTGNLAGSIMPYADQAVAEAFTNVPYAGYHVSDAPRKRLPKRDFTDIDFEAAQAEAVDMILSQVLAPAAE
jgi:phage gpG-like protein